MCQWYVQNIWIGQTRQCVSGINKNSDQITVTLFEPAWDLVQPNTFCDVRDKPIIIP
jgi:hypothetical protein